MIIENKIKSNIYNIRDLNIMIDSDLAKLYQVETKQLNQAVKRNIKRFPKDFMFQLTQEEFEKLRSQFVTTKFSMTRTPPYIFTENGIAMLSSVLKSDISIEVNIEIMRTFTKIREFALNYKDIVIKLQNIEESIKLNKEDTKQNTKHIKTAFELLSQILEDTVNTNNNLIGFKV